MKLGMIRGICAEQVISYFGEFCSTFSSAQIFDSGYLAHFLSEGDEIWKRVTKFGMVRGLAN